MRDSCESRGGCEGASAICTLYLLPLAVLLEAAFGYPRAVQRTIGHPVEWIGWLIACADTALNRDAMTARVRRMCGVLAAGIVIFIAVIAGAALQVAVLRLLPLWLALLLLAALASSLLAQRSLHAHVAAVGLALGRADIAGARLAVARIVGRDTEVLDPAAVARAAIESLAENFSDGVVAPVFWGVFFGLPGMVFYKTVNTADSMIGHRTPRHEAFGWFSARLDDWINLPASRLAALWLCTGAAVSRRGDWRCAVSTVWRDANRHRSPNAGWPESAMAGALGVRLAGPRFYHGARVDDAWMGSGRADADFRDVQCALSLYRASCAVQFGALGLGALVAAIVRC